MSYALPINNRYRTLENVEKTIFFLGSIHTKKSFAIKNVTNLIVIKFAGLRTPKIDPTRFYGYHDYLKKVRR